MSNGKNTKKNMLWYITIFNFTFITNCIKIHLKYYFVATKYHFDTYAFK